MKVSQFLQDFFRSDDEILVSCVWLQDQLKAIASYHNECVDKDNQIKMLKYKIGKLEAKIALKEIEEPFRLDISA